MPPIHFFESYNYISSGVFVVDRNSTLLFWNRTIETLSGIKSEEIVGKNLFEIFPHLSKSLFKLRLNSVLQGGPPEVFSALLHKFIIPCMAQDGEFRRQNTTMLGMHFNGDIYAVFSIQDVTTEFKQIENAKKLRDVALLEVEERKKIAAELHTTVLELEQHKQQLEEQAVILQENNNKLAASEKELKEMNAAKNLLFSIIAHDLRSPLQGLIGYTHLLLHEAEDLTEDEKLNFLAYTHQISQNLNVMIENLLEWARLQSEKIVVEKEVFPTRKLISECLNILHPVAAKKDIKLLIDNESPTLFAHGDTNMIKTVLRNLLSNAIKFTPRGGEITISVNIRETSALFAIADNGVGIPADKLSRIFDIEKSKSTTGTEKEEGSGLGLVLCKEFIQKNAGAIWVESTINQGTTFYFTVPLAK